MLRSQNFGLTRVVARRADQGTPKPYAVVSRTDSNRNADLSGNDHSLLFTEATIEIYSSEPSSDAPIAETIAIFLEESINVIMGDRTLFGCTVTGPDDFENPPVDGSSNWNGGSKLAVHFEHN
jgi:hypothetical protein